MSQHTPGPWKVAKGGFAENGDARYELAGIKSIGAKDAQLIAAAPDMLEALQALVACDTEAIEDAEAAELSFPPEMLANYNKARAAITKATGKAP